MPCGTPAGLFSCIKIKPESFPVAEPAGIFSVAKILQLA